MVRLLTTATRTQQPHAFASVTVVSAASEYFLCNVALYSAPHVVARALAESFTNFPASMGRTHPRCCPTAALRMSSADCRCSDLTHRDRESASFKVSTKAGNLAQPTLSQRSARTRTSQQRLQRHQHCPHAKRGGPLVLRQRTTHRSALRSKRLILHRPRSSCWVTAGAAYLQDVQADVACSVDVRVETCSDELHSRGLVRVLVGERH